MENIRNYLNTELKIGNKKIKNRLVFASMSKLGNVAFRMLLEHFGSCGLYFSEMSSAVRIPFENPKNSNVYRFYNEEKDKLVWQILGSDPEKMSIAASRIENDGFFGVDLNFSCSAAKIVKKGFGAAILKDSDTAVNIVRAIRNKVQIPIFIKYRTGWKDDPKLAVDLAKKFEQSGADALTFHPRVAPDRRTRKPKWEYISKVKKAVNIPVFGNGNVFTFEDCIKMIQTTNCDGISLGRIAVNSPWIFDKWLNNKEINYNIYLETVKIYIKLLQDNFNEKIAIKRFKKFVFYYCAGFKYGHSLYSKLINCNSFNDLLKEFEIFFLQRPEHLEIPNANLIV